MWLDLSAFIGGSEGQERLNTLPLQQREYVAEIWHEKRWQRRDERWQRWLSQVLQVAFLT